MSSNTDKKSDKKEHADFQNEYRRSSNFPKVGEDETDDLVIKGDGELKVKVDGVETTETDSEKIKDALDILNDEEE